jgi:integrase
MQRRVEFRDRSGRHPSGGELRFLLGTASNRTELKELHARRDLMKRLADRGEWDILDAVKHGRYTAAEIERLVDRHGVADFHLHVDVEPEATVPRLDAHVERWLETVRRPSTQKRYRDAIQRLRDHELEGVRFGDRPWHHVLPHHVRDLAEGLAHRQDATKRLAPATVQLHVAAWSAFFTWALRRERSEARELGRRPVLQSNPVRDAEVWVSVRPTRHRFLTEDEYFRWIDSAPEHMRAVYATLTLAGLRLGELVHLPAAHVVPDSHIHVGPFGGWRPKSRRGVRDVPVHPTHLRPLLEEYSERWAGDEYFFQHPHLGERWDGQTLRKHFQRDVEAAGLPYGAAVDGITPHVCRHTFASWLAQRDVQLLKIAQLMGDTEPVVREHYAHLLPSHLDESVRRLFSGPVSHSMTTTPPESRIT